MYIFFICRAPCINYVFEPLHFHLCMIQYWYVQLIFTLNFVYLVEIIES